MNCFNLKICLILFNQNKLKYYDYIKTCAIVKYKELVTYFAQCWFKVDFSYCCNFRKSLIF